MSPINIKLRIAKKKTKPGRSNHIFPFPSYMHQYLIKDLRRYIQDIFTFNLAPEDDIRYQWAINNTKASKLLLIHDDIMFKGNIIEKYLEEFEKNPNLIIVGDLGQCNICAHQNVCSPEKILKKEYPSEIYPLTERREKAKGIFGRKYERSCRINEWCCMLDVAKTKTVKAHFGNCVDGGDTGAFWFEKAFKAGFDFTDPLLSAEEKQKYYFHCWQGNAGHSIWLGTQSYKKDLVNSKLYEDFGYKLRY